MNLQFGWETVAKCFFLYRPEVAVPDISEFEIQPGDVIFLCSDGVNKYVRPDIMKDRLLDDRTPEQIADVIRRPYRSIWVKFIFLGIIMYNNNISMSRFSNLLFNFAEDFLMASLQISVYWSSESEIFM